MNRRAEFKLETKENKHADGLFFHSPRLRPSLSATTPKEFLGIACISSFEDRGVGVS